MSTTLPSGTGQGRIAAWLAGAFLAPIVLTVFSSVYTSALSTGQRVAALEAEFREIKANLDRIGAKLDHLLEHPR
jgi:hypothetical protein